MDLPSSKLSWHKKDLSQRGRVPALLLELQIPEDRIPLPLTNTDKEQYINHGDLVGCANYYTILFSCPIIYLNYFWCIKYQHINICMKMEKEMGKGKRKRDSQLAGPGGDLGPAERGQAAHQARQRGNGVGTTPWVWAHVPEEEGG
jgi:hypothetical protein